VRFSVLGSGSKGNCTLVEAGTTRLLVDSGFSGKEVIRRLKVLGIEPESLTAIVVTHEHDDHVKGIGVLARRLNLPVYANEGTHRAAETKINRLPDACDFGVGEPFAIGELQIHPFAVSHDASDPVGFVFSDGLQQLGYCTDTGTITRLIQHHLRRCQAVILEANHDVQMVKNGPYPLMLQQRVLSSRGHLANEDSLSLAALLAGEQLRLLVLAHLSAINNHPDLVLKAAQQHLPDEGAVRLMLSGQDQPLSMMRLKT
jgi:phosphoribosyl 1,2-cyclic phosphodiesterase